MSKYEQILTEIEEFIDNCKRQKLSGVNIIVNKEQLEEYISELRMKTPEEIRKYQRIINNKEAIMNDAQARAEDMLQQAREETSELISEHEIMQQAYAQANEVVTMATRQAQEILDNATMEANNVKMSAMQYMDDMLAHLENIIATSSQTATANYDTLIGNLNHYHEIIQSNRAELHPAEDELEEVDMDAEQGDNLDAK